MFPKFKCVDQGAMNKKVRITPDGRGEVGICLGGQAVVHADPVIVVGLRQGAQEQKLPGIGPRRLLESVDEMGDGFRLVDIAEFQKLMEERGIPGDQITRQIGAERQRRVDLLAQLGEIINKCNK